MTQKRLQYIFDQCTDQRPFFKSYSSPWIFEDGRIYATDGYLMLCLENSEDRDKAFTDNGAVHPNVRGFIPPFDKDFKANRLVSLNELEGLKGYCNLAGTSISHKNAARIAKILHLFGMETAVFGKTAHNRIIFEIIDSDKITGMLLCTDHANETSVTVPFTDTDLRPNEAKLYDALINEERGERYFQKCLDHDKREQEEYDKENYTVFEVTLSRSKTICVKAETEEEAKMIALDNACYIDFDGCVEVDECSESCKYDCCDTYSKYYDVKGGHEWYEPKN